MFVTIKYIEQRMESKELRSAVEPYREILQKLGMYSEIEYRKNP